MVDEQLLREHFDTNTFNSIVEVFSLLSQLGVWQLQVDANIQRVCGGFTNADSEALAKEILQVQQTNRHLLALHGLGQMKKKGKQDA